MLEYENQMLLDILHEDGLMIAARGLGIQQILTNLLNTYSDEGNLVLVIGTSHHEEEYIISQLKDRDVSPLPKSVTADCSVNSRAQLYLKGGCLFVTSRILVVDLLKDRVPAHLITGIVIWKAHRILESCQEAFILRLYRQKNKTGFIKALSSNPLSFTVGFCHVERVMKNLFVKKLYIWPRFHVNVSECLNECKPEVIELHLQMTPSMKQIQMATLDLITSTLNELKLSNRAIDFEEFCTENAISKAFEKMLRIQLDPIWHQLSTRTKQLVADLRVLRTVLTYLCQYDSVTFYNLVSSLRSTEKVMESAGWMLLPAAEMLLLHAKARIYGEAAGKEPLAKKLKESGGHTSKEKFKEPCPEVNPKWTVLGEILDEMKKENESREEQMKCLIVTQDDRTCNQLKEYIIDGANKMLKRNFYRCLGPKLGLVPPAGIFSAKNGEGKGDGVKIEVGNTRVGLKPVLNKEKSKKEEELTLTQMTRKYPPKEGEDSSKGSDEGVRAESSEDSKKLLVAIHSFKDQNDPFKMTKILEELNPHFIVMYDSDLEFVRQVEVWQARNSQIKCRVYFPIYKGTVEEQIYLTSIKREKNAFEYLIKEKASMVIPEYADGRNDDHPDLNRNDQEEEQNQTSKNALSRKAGRSSPEMKAPQRVIVDMREFRSELPSILHKKGIEIDPATIEVGDYILTPDICVERKSISDLIGSLNSGRLYNQAQAMTRYYKKPILLIEFDHNKPFHLQGRLFVSNDSSSSPKDVTARLQLLTIHFPKLRIIWSASPYATAEVFSMLKSGNPEPSVKEAQAVNSDANPEYDTEKFNSFIKDFLSKLPGVTSKNIYALMRGAKDLPGLLKLSEGDLEQLLDSSKNAKDLYTALHKTVEEPTKEPPEQKRGKTRTKFGKKPLKLKGK